MAAYTKRPRRRMHGAVEALKHDLRGCAPDALDHAARSGDGRSLWRRICR